MAGPTLSTTSSVAGGSGSGRPVSPGPNGGRWVPVAPLVTEARSRSTARARGSCGSFSDQTRVAITHAQEPRRRNGDDVLPSSDGAPAGEFSAAHSDLNAAYGPSPQLPLISTFVKTSVSPRGVPEVFRPSVQTG